MKTCNQCKIPKTLDFYSKNKVTRDGLDNKCKAYYSIKGKELVKKGYYKEKYQLNREVILARMREKQPQTKESKRAYRRNNPDKVKQYKLNQLGVLSSIGERFTFEEYQLEIEKCGNSCMICTKDAVSNKKSLAVDHDHETGIYRGLLCGSCNVVLGLVNDDPLILKRMVQYLKKSKYGC